MSLIKEIIEELERDDRSIELIAEISANTDRPDEDISGYRRFVQCDRDSWERVLTGIKKLE
jgi:hypothetical protein